jgi:DNA repair protein RecO
MARSHSYEALVLRSIDVGEADRFCILFTKQRGRIAARARGVRKLMSRMGGSLLPFSHVRVELVETERSLTITSASSLTHHLLEQGSYEAFERLTRGVELALALTEDDEPLPQVFDLLLTFVHAAAVPGCSPVLPFSLCLLHLLGLLPLRAEDRRFDRLSPSAKAFAERCVKARDIDVLCEVVPEAHELQIFVDSVLADHLKRPLKA